MRVKDSTGRECSIEYESDAYDFFECVQGAYDDGTEIPEGECEWIADRYASDIYQDIAECRASDSLDAWKAYSRGDSY
jgi:hypothetical protein